MVGRTVKAGEREERKEKVCGEWRKKKEKKMKRREHEIGANVGKESLAVWALV